MESALPLPVAVELVQLELRFTGLDVDRETRKLLWMADRFLLTGKMMEPLEGE